MAHGQSGRNGEKRPSEYVAWINMKARCNNMATKNYGDYGGRGIAVCGRWNSSFEAFLADMGPKPSPGHTIDRIDVDGNYSAENCRWATWHEQATNRRNSIVVEFNGKRMTVAEWARDIGMSYPGLYKRLTNGWPIEKALTTPSQKARKIAC